MFGLWLEGVGDLKTATWNNLIQTLRDVNLTEIAVKLSNLVCFEFPAILMSLYYALLIYCELVSHWACSNGIIFILLLFRK